MKKSVYRTRLAVTLTSLGYSLFFFFREVDYLAGALFLFQGAIGLYATGSMLQGHEALQRLVPDLKKNDSYETIGEFRRVFGLAFFVLAIIAFLHQNRIPGLSFWLLGMAFTHPLDRFFFAPVPEGHPDLSLILPVLLRNTAPLIAIGVAIAGITTSSPIKNGWALVAAGCLLTAALILQFKGNPQFSKKMYYRDGVARTYAINRASQLNPNYFQLLILDYQVEWLESRDYWQTLAQQADREAFKAQTIRELFAQCEVIKKRKVLQHASTPGVSVLDEIADLWHDDPKYRSLFNAAKAWSARPGSRKLSAIMAHVAEYRAMIKLMRVIRHRTSKWPVEWPQEPAQVASPAPASAPAPVPKLRRPGSDKTLSDAHQALGRLIGSLPQLSGTQTLQALRQQHDKLYYKIIDDIIRLGQDFENFPALNRNFNEERYRDYFLPYLNSFSPDHTAKGEVFNRRGKTDILVCDHSGNNIFIAECKIWTGKAYLLDGVDQLLNNYIGWRDERAALIIFNQTVRNFTSVIRTATEALSQHPLCQRAAVQRTPASWSCLFRHPDDAEQTIKLELILFNFT